MFAIIFEVRPRPDQSDAHLEAAEALFAAEIGFSSRSHFSRVFSDQYGIDPSTFRRRNDLGFNSDKASS